MQNNQNDAPGAFNPVGLKEELPYQFTAADRFMRYVQIDTQSDPLSSSFPSTEKQKDLSRLLVAELKAIGIIDAHMDEWGYIYATIPATSKKDVPVICFCSHVDTAQMLVVPM